MSKETAELISRLNANRDTLKGLNIGDYTLIRDARNAMADAANAITERDETIRGLRQEAETLRSDLLDAKDDVDRLTAELRPCVHCGGSGFERWVGHGNSEVVGPCSACQS